MAQEIDVTVQDSIVNIKDSNGNPIITENILAEGTKDIIINDGQVVVKRTDGTNILADYVVSGSIKNVTVNDSSITLNGVLMDNVMASSFKNIVVKNQYGSTVGNKIGNEWIVDTTAAGDNEIFIRQYFDETISISDTINIDSFNVGSFTVINTSNTGVTEIKKNGSVVTVPFTLTSGNTLIFTRTDTTLDGWIEIKGTF